MTKLGQSERYISSIVSTTVRIQLLSEVANIKLSHKHIQWFTSCEKNVSLYVNVNTKKIGRITMYFSCRKAISLTLWCKTKDSAKDFFWSMPKMGFGNENFIHSHRRTAENPDLCTEVLL